MSSVEWYYARGTKQSGPVAPAELKRLALAGAIHPDDLVWREGLTEWIVAGHVRGLFDEQGHSGVGVDTVVPPPTATEPSNVASGVPMSPPSVAVRGPRLHWPVRHPLDMLLDYFRSSVSQHFIETTTRLFRQVGLYGLLLAMIPSMLFGLLAVVKTQEPRVLLLAIAVPPVFIVLHYVAGKFCDVVEQFNRNTCCTMASTAVLDCFALLSPAIGIGVLLASVTLTMSPGAILGPTLGIVGFIVCLYAGCVALNPSSLNLTIVPKARASEEAIGLMSFVLKALLQSVPIWFGAGVASGFLIMVYACCQAIVGKDTESGLALAGAVVTATAASMIFLLSAAIPTIAYFGFVIGHLSLDLMLAVLAAPRRLAGLASEEKGHDEMVDGQGRNTPSGA